MLCGIVGALAVLGNSLVQIIGSGHILNVMSNGTIPMWLGELIILCAIAFYVYAQRSSGYRLDKCNAGSAYADTSQLQYACLCFIQCLALTV